MKTEQKFRTKFRIYFPTNFTDEIWKELWLCISEKYITEEFPDMNYWEFTINDFDSLPQWIKNFIEKES